MYHVPSEHALPLLSVFNIVLMKNKLFIIRLCLQQTKITKQHLPNAVLVYRLPVIY